MGWRLFGIGLVSSSVGFSLPALAQQATVASSQPPKAKCVHSLPSGAAIDFKTGAVTLNGSPVSLGACEPGPNNGTSGGYYVQTNTAKNPSPTLTISDNFGGYFTVPGYPANNSSTGPEYTSYWPGLLAWHWPANQFLNNPAGNVVLQPVLNWALDVHTQVHGYAAANAINMGGLQFQSTPFTVYPGDVIENYIYRLAADLDSWQVVTIDFTQNNYSTYLQVNNIPEKLPKFNTAIVALEGFGDQTINQPPLPSCADLPPSGNLTYNILTFDQPIPNPNSYTPLPATPNIWSGSSGAFTFFPTTGPNCGWAWAPTNTYAAFAFTP